MQIRSWGVITFRNLRVDVLASIDRIIQRAGRLRRHRRGADGTPLATPAAADERGTPGLWVLTPPWTDAPDARWYRAAFPKAAAVCANHGQNWLTARDLQGPQKGPTQLAKVRHLVARKCEVS
jgi:CRISPR-associated endonuclease/helicase Cas3